EQLKFIIRQLNRRNENRIDTTEYRLYRTHWRHQIRIDTRCCRAVVASRSKDVQVMPNGVFKARKGTVVEKRWLQRHVAQRRRTKLVTIERVAGDLLEPEIFILSWSIERYVTNGGRNLRNTDHVL